MVAKKSFNFKNLGEIFLDFTVSLPFLWFLIVPFTYDFLNGYSIILCFLLAGIFIVFSSFSWLELKSRYLLACSSNNESSFRNRLNIIHGRLKTNYNKLNFLVMLESTLGINIAVIICICYIINGLCLHCFTIKWFFEDITHHLFHFLDDEHVHATCSSVKNSSQNESNSSMLYFSSNKTYNHSLFKSNYYIIITEQLINGFYFFYVSIVTLFLTKIMSKSGKSNERISNKSTSDFIDSINESPLNVNLNSKQSIKNFTRNLFFGFVFYVLMILILTFTYSISSFSLQVKCEEFFKNNSKMFFMSIAIISTTLYTILFNDFTKLHKFKKQPKKRVNFLNCNERNVDTNVWKIKRFSNTILKISITCIVTIFFIISLNTFSSYRNVCCLDFLESILSDENHTIHIIKQLCLTFICFYIFNFSHENIKSVGKNASEIIYYLFESENQKYVKTNHGLFREHKNDGEVYRSTTSNANQNGKKRCCSCQIFNYYVLFFDENSLLIKKIESLVIFLFFLITILKLLFMEKVQLIYLWSISFLVMNLFIVGAVLLINYIPYQVLIDFHSKDLKKYSNSFLFETREDVSIIHEKVSNQPQASPSRETNDKNEEIEENDQMVDAKSIEIAFQDYKKTLKNIALSNKELSFGNNQPCMISAYKAILGFGLFLVCSFTLSIILDFVMLAIFEDIVSSWKIMLLSSISSILIFMFLILFSYLFFIKNSKETIYVKHVYYKSPCLPILQLIVCFINTFLIIKTTYFIVSLFFMQLFIYLSFLLISYKIFRFIKFKAGDLKTGYEVKNDVFTVVHSSKNYSERIDFSESLYLSDSDLPQNSKKDYSQHVSVASNLHLIS